MLLPLCVLCSKIAIKKDFMLKSRDAIFPAFTVRTLVENLLVCGVLYLSHRGTPHTIGAKRFNLGFFLSSCVVSHILKIL